MNSISHLHRLDTAYRIDRPYTDPGTSFPGDTVPIQKVTSHCFAESGFCLVSQIDQTFSSHSGTHADQPPHFHPNPEYHSFSDEHYNGAAIVLDVSDYLSKSISVITRLMLENAIAKTVDSDADCFERILVRTQNENELNNAPLLHFPHFSLEAAMFLVQRKSTKLVGIDTTSVDGPNEKKLDEAVHGIFYDNHVAIVENLDLRRVPAEKSGILKTIFDPQRSFPDAKGVFAMFFLPS